MCYDMSVSVGEHWIITHFLSEMDSNNTPPKQLSMRTLQMKIMLKMFQILDTNCMLA